MYYYKIYGQSVISDLEMSILQKTEPTDCAEDQAIYVMLGSMPAPYDQMPGKSYHYSSDIGFLSNDGCNLLILNGKKIIYQPKPHPYSKSLVSYILGFGMAMLFLQRKQLAFHCSCIAKGGRAVLIGGPSGSGKSTITNALLKKGFMLMSDDMTVVDPFHPDCPMAYPAFPYQKLCRNVIEYQKLNKNALEYINKKKNKYLVPAPSFYEKEAPVHAMIHLAVSDTLPIDGDMPLLSNPPAFAWCKLKGLTTWEACKQALFLHACLVGNLHEKELAEPTLRFSSLCPMYQIVRRNNSDSTEGIAELIEKIVNES